MEVIDKREGCRIAFRCLKIGETFLNLKGELCQKIKLLWGDEEDRYNTVQLKTGIVSYSCDYDDVIPVDATVTFTDKYE